MTVPGPPVGCSSVSGYLWHQSTGLAWQSLCHPFVTQLASGQLSQSNFAGYVAQDAHFLLSFAKAYALALAKAPDLEGVRSFHQLIGAVLTELELHAAYAETLGISQEQMQTPNRATSAYCGFLLETAGRADSSVADILASVAPCMRLYAFLGQTIKDNAAPPPEHPYREWIDTYSSNGFEADAALVEQLLDQYGREDQRDRLLSLYRRAMQLEYEFFDAQGVEAETAVGLHGRVGLLCLDFDETCTTADTTPLLMRVATSVRHADREDIEREWAELTELYLRDYGAVAEAMQAAETATGPEATGLRPVLEDLLRKFERVDEVSVGRVSASKVLRGLSREDIQRSVREDLRQHWGLQAGFAGVLLRALRDPRLETHILSVNWSEDVIRTALGSCLTELSHELQSECMPIVCNNLRYDERGVSTGEVVRSVGGAQGKLECFRRLLEGNRNGGRAGLSVYVGDSVTDLLCMLEADVGIVMGDSSTFRHTASRHGVAVRPLATAVLAPPACAGAAAKAREPTVYRASSWAEIGACLFRPTGAESQEPSEGYVSSVSG